MLDQVGDFTASPYLIDLASFLYLTFATVQVPRDFSSEPFFWAYCSIYVTLSSHQPYDLD